MKTAITFELDTDRLQGYTDQHLAALWHISQANPAPFGDAAACDFAEDVGREIVRRFLANTPPALWNHQGRHIHRGVSEHAAQPEAPSIDAHLLANVPPGAFVTILDLLQALGTDPGQSSNTLEGQVRDALKRCGFTATREVGGARRRGFVAPNAAVDSAHPRCPPAPLQEHGTHSVPPPSSHPSGPNPAPLQPASPPPIEQPARTEPHQLPGAFDSPACFDGASLSTEGGAA